MPSLTDAGTVELRRLLRCPNCHGGICFEEALVRCDSCANHWPVRDEIPEFTGPSVDAGEGQIDDYTRALPELVEVARTDGWLQALERVIRPLPQVGPGMVSYVTDESKGDLVYLLDIRAEQTVIDMGCGLGAVTVAAARRGAICYAVDVAQEQATFAMIRCHQMGFQRVLAVCAGGDMKLPFPTEQIDTVILNGVIEWAGCSKTFEGTPEQAQHSMLTEICRVLKPGGLLYVATKNRFSLLHLLGGRGAHMSRIPWVGMLPPRLRSLATLGRERDTGDRIHGRNGYRRLFTSTGFREVATYALLPTFRRTRRIVPLSVPSPVGFRGRGTKNAYTRRLEGLVARVLPARVYKHLVHSFGFVLAKT